MSNSDVGPATRVDAVTAGATATDAVDPTEEAAAARVGALAAASSSPRRLLRYWHCA